MEFGITYRTMKFLWKQVIKLISHNLAIFLYHRLTQAVNKSTHLFIITLGILLARIFPHGNAVNLKNDLIQTVLDEEVEDNVAVLQKVFVKDANDQNSIRINLDFEDEVVEVQGIRRDLGKWSHHDENLKKKKKKKSSHKSSWSSKISWSSKSSKSSKGSKSSKSSKKSHHHHKWW